MKIFTLLLLVIANGKFLVAQKAYFEYLTVRNGLSQNNVQSIVKDNFGFMWFGTMNGLCRYDGYNFKLYNAIPGDSTSIANNRIHYIYKDANGTLWITTFNAFICRYNYQTDNFTRFRAGVLPQTIRDSADRHRNLTALTNAATILQEKIGSFQLSPTKEHVVFQTKPNNMGGLNDNNVFCVYNDNCGILWLGTPTGGVNKLDLNAKRFHSFSLSAGNKMSINTSILAIFADSSGIWLGTHNDGLFFIDRKTKIEKQFKTEIGGKNIRSIFKDSYGDIWIGSRTGLDKYEVRKNNFITYYDGNTAKTPTNYRFISMAEDPVDHSVWFGAFKDVYKYNRKADSLEKQSLGRYFDNSSATCLFFDSKNNLWIGTAYAGIIQLKRDPNTHIWTDTITYTADGATPQLPDTRVYSITEDELGSMWAGTANGLCRINPKSGKVKVFSKQDGLADQYIAKILADKRGNIWISHKKGLSKLTIRTGAIRNYTIKESLLGYEGIDGSGCVDETSGELYFGGVEELVSFRPEEIRDNPYLPVVTLTDLQVLNKLVGIGQRVNDRTILTSPLNLTKKITLTHEDHNFSIEFAALHYSDPEKNQYAYTLEGLDDGWIYTDASRRIASYTNLPDGKYTFKVKASNNDGLWNPSPAMLEIIVLPPWWKTWWAYLLYTAAIILAVIFLVRNYHKRLQNRNKRQMEQLEVAKAKEMYEEKLNFFINVTHEIKTPLTLIKGPLETIMKEVGNVPEIAESLKIMNRNTNRLVDLTNQLLDFRQTEINGFSMQFVRMNISELLMETFEGFRPLATSRNLEYRICLPNEPVFACIDTEAFLKILTNLFSNATKYAARIVEVNLTGINESTVSFTIEISNDGFLIPSDMSERIFEPFFRLKETQKHKGTGIGLALSLSLARLHNGTIKLNSKIQLMNTFSLTLPVKQAT